MDRSSDDFHAHISAMLKSPSIMHGVPQYPNVHKAFKHDPNNMEGQQQQKQKGFELCKWKNTEGLDQM
ncbi:hypothetical protein LINGRAHAP2_LOCUS16931 [Linum grandiflorum]